MRLGSSLIGIFGLAAWVVSLCAAQPPVPPLPEDPRRVVSLVPSLTESACWLGAQQRLVGRSDFCDTPASVQSLPAVGGFYDPRLEDILRLKPDLVLAEIHQQWLVQRCQEFGVAAVGFSFASLHDTGVSLRQLADILKTSDEDKQRAEQFSERLEQVSRTVDRPPRVLWLNYRDAGALTGMIALGPGGHTHELLLRAGCVNVLEDSPRMANTLTPETLLGLRPDIILDDVRFVMDRPDWRQEVQAIWRPWLEHPALQHTRWIPITDDIYYRPGPRLVEALEQLAELIHLEE